MIIKTYTPPNYTILHLTSVDFVKRSTQRVINLVQYDSGLQVIGVVLYSNSIEYSIPDNAQIRIRWGKRDGTYVFPELLGCNSKRNTIYFSLNEQMTVIPGNIDPIVEIIYNDGSAQSQSFPVRIEKNPISNDSIESDTEYHDYLATVMKSVQEINEKIDTDYLFTPALQDPEPDNEQYHVWLCTVSGSSNQNGAKSATLDFTEDLTSKTTFTASESTPKTSSTTEGGLNFTTDSISTLTSAASETNTQSEDTLNFTDDTSSTITFADNNSASK